MINQSTSYAGKCRCAAVQFVLDLPKSLHHYAPRTCDCNFCQNQQISYLSDPKASLTLNCPSPLRVLKQGSQQASFLCCPNCQDLLAATFGDGNGLKGAVNANLLEANSSMLPGITVSPKNLTSIQKIARWNEMWMSVVIIQNIR